MAYLHQNKYFEVNKQDLLKLVSEETALLFISWVRNNAPLMRFPWGDKGFHLQNWETHQPEKQVDVPENFKQIIQSFTELNNHPNTDLIFKP